MMDFFLVYVVDNIQMNIIAKPQGSWTKTLEKISRPINLKMKNYFKNFIKIWREKLQKSETSKKFALFFVYVIDNIKMMIVTKAQVN